MKQKQKQHHTTKHCGTFHNYTAIFKKRFFPLSVLWPPVRATTIRGKVLETSAEVEGFTATNNLSQFQ